MANKERTMVLVKPDGVERSLVGEIISRFEKVGLRLVGLKMVKADAGLASAHYGQNDEWYENIGVKVKAFYEKIGYDPGEEFAKLTNRQIGESVQQWNIDYLLSGNIVAMIWEGGDVVQVVRKMVGATYPLDALPGTIRGDYSTESPLVSNVNKRSVRNLVHASGTPAEAEKEIEMWFKKDEILD